MRDSHGHPFQPRERREAGQDIGTLRHWTSRHTAGARCVRRAAHSCAFGAEFRGPDAPMSQCPNGPTAELVLKDPPPLPDYSCELEARCSQQVGMDAGMTFHGGLFTWLRFQ